MGMGNAAHAAVVEATAADTEPIQSDTERIEATPCRTLGRGPTGPALPDYSACRDGPYQ